MNNRQKAKRFKRLYEETLATRVSPKVIDLSRSILRFRVKCLVRDETAEDIGDYEMLMDSIADKLSHDMIPAVKQRLETTRNEDNTATIYSFDFFLTR